MGLGARQLPCALGELRRRHPHLQVTIHEEPDPTDMERLARQGTLDMVLVHDIPPGCTFDIHTLGKEAYVAVLPQGHPLLRSDKPLRLDDLAAEGWVRFRRTSKLDEYLARLLADRGLAPRTVGRASQISTAVRLAAQGVGVTIAPFSAIPDGFDHLTRPLRPALSEPVLAGVRHAPGRAETALLDQLKRQDWTSSTSMN